MSAFRVLLSCAALALCANARPSLSVANTINLGTPIVVSYSLSDGIDGRTVAQAENGENGVGKYLSETGNDWIGLFKKGECQNVANNQDKHKCHVHWFYVPAHMASGSVTFEAEHYKTAGEYEARYFYGDDPTIPGAYSWVGQGWVCNTWSDLDTNGVVAPNEFTMRQGQEGNPEVIGMELAQCQCDPALTTQNIMIGGVSTATTQAECQGYRAACGRCTLDAVGYSNSVEVTGPGGISEYQNMASLPGFEIGF